MAVVVSPGGTVATVDDELAAVLVGKGWVSEAAEPKKKPGRPKKSE